MVTAQSINELLEAVEPSLKEFRQRQEKRDQSDAPRFSAFTYIQPDEVRLSRIIKDLLDPKGPHGQGHVFLQEFLSLLKLDHQATSTVRVVCEERVPAPGSGRPHDIFLDSPDGWVLSIENKPWAQDQRNQVSDYLKDLETRRRPNWHLVYLTKGGRPPSENSIQTGDMKQKRKDGHLILLSFEQLEVWLVSCRARSQASRVKEYLADFQQYIHEQLLGFAPAKEQTMIVEAVLKNNHLEAALELLRSADNLYGKLLEEGMSTIRQSLEGWKVTSALSFDNYSLVLKPPPYAQGWSIRFEDTGGEAKKWEKWIYGIRYEEDVRKDDKKKEALKPLKQHLEDHLGPSERDYGYFLWYRYFDGHSRDAISDYANKRKPRLWMDMHNGEFAKHIVELARSLYREACDDRAPTAGRSP